MTVKSYGKTYEVEVSRSAYRNNNSLAIILTCTNGEPFATLTVNLNSGLEGEDFAFVDTNNCPWAEDFIRENALGTPTGLTQRSGFCTYPLYHFDNL